MKALGALRLGRRQPDRQRPGRCGHAGAGLVAGAVLLLGALVAGTAAAAPRVLVLASTTSTQASGLLDHLLPCFEAETGIAVRVIARGTGHALRLARSGDADALLVHDPVGERRLVAEGHASARRTVMANDFVIVGPSSDPAAVAGLADAAEVFRRIAVRRARFVSRGDDSGTHRAERRLWRAAGIDPGAEGPGWYLEAGAGMAATLRIARELRAYTLTDRATWLAQAPLPPLALLSQGDPRLVNPYSVLLVNPARHAHVNAEAARAFFDWLSGPRGQAAVAAFRIGGRPAFRPATPTGAPNPCPE